MHGEKGDGLLRALNLVLDRDSVTGMELYNFMTIIKMLDIPTGMIVSALADTDFPEPDIAWHRELL
jgi:hypothetical protein